MKDRLRYLLTASLFLGACAPVQQNGEQDAGTGDTGPRVEDVTPTPAETLQPNLLTNEIIKWQGFRDEKSPQSRFDSFRGIGEDGNVEVLRSASGKEYSFVEAELVEGSEIRRVLFATAVKDGVPGELTLLAKLPADAPRLNPDPNADQYVGIGLRDGKLELTSAGVLVVHNTSSGPVWYVVEQSDDGSVRESLLGFRDEVQKQKYDELRRRIDLIGLVGGVLSLDPGLGQAEANVPTATATPFQLPMREFSTATPDRGNLEPEARPTASPEAVAMQPTTVTISEDNLNSIVLNHYSMGIRSAEHIPGFASIVLDNAAMVSLHIESVPGMGGFGAEVTALLVYKNKLMRVKPDMITINNIYYLLPEATSDDISSILRIYDSVARSPHRQPSVMYGNFSPIRGSQRVCEVGVQIPSFYKLCNSVSEEAKPETRSQLMGEVMAQIQSLPILPSRDELSRKVKTEWWRDEGIPLVELETPSSISFGVE